MGFIPLLILQDRDHTKYMKPLSSSIISSLYQTLCYYFAGEITPNIRGVQIEYQEERIFINCYFDGEIADEEIEEISLIETDLICSFYGEHNVLINCICIRLDAPKNIPISKFTSWLYLRKED